MRGILIWVDIFHAKLSQNSSYVSRLKLKKCQNYEYSVCSTPSSRLCAENTVVKDGTTNQSFQRDISRESMNELLGLGKYGDSFYIYFGTNRLWKLKTEESYLSLYHFCLPVIHHNRLQTGSKVCI